jgi:hypothetical protein
VTPAITTNAAPSIALGETATDTATVVGVPGALPPSGTVTFTVFGPDDADCSGDPVFSSDPAGLTETEPGIAVATASFTPTAAGTYLWVATYSGDANYGPVSTACGDVNETTVVTAPPTPPVPPETPTLPPLPPGLLPRTGANAVRTLLVAVGLLTVGSA